MTSEDFSAQNAGIFDCFPLVGYASINGYWKDAPSFRTYRSKATLTGIESVNPYAPIPRRATWSLQDCVDDRQRWHGRGNTSVPTPGSADPSRSKFPRASSMIVLSARRMPSRRSIIPISARCTMSARTTW